MNYDLDTKDGMANAIRWTEQMFSTMKDTSKWVIPRSGTVVKINKTIKTATIQHIFAPDPSIARVLEAMGWKVTVVEE